MVQEQVQVQFPPQQIIPSILSRDRNLNTADIFRFTLYTGCECNKKRSAILLAELKHEP
jgi:hypothetical protein